METVIDALRSQLVQMMNLPVSVWLSAGLFLLLLGAIWACFKLWHHLHETEERINAELAATKIRTWEPVANDMKQNAQTASRVAQEALANHLVILNAALDAKTRANHWPCALDLTEELLSHTVHAMCTPGMEARLVRTCSELVTSRLSLYPDLVAANGKPGGDAFEFLKKLHDMLGMASPGLSVTRVQACLMETAFGIDPDARL